MASKRTLDHSSCVASSSSSTQPRWAYHVFLSFRGEDTRKNFTDHLYEALVQAGIHTFRDDDELPRGHEISPELLKSIEASRIAIVVFSRNYASSGWCLDELVKIIECKKTLGQLVLPIFYDVDPSHVRHQTGYFGEAFGRHEKRYVDEMEKVEVRRAALSEAANLSGWDLQNVANGHEAKFIRKVVEEVSCKLERTSLFVAKHPVGIESRVQHIKSLLRIGSDDVCMIGIYGLGGIGKTALAQAVYNCISCKFEGSCFLADIAGRQNGLVQLQKLLLSDLLKIKNLNFHSVGHGINLMKERLHSKKVLVVLDDVDQLDQLETLAGNHDWFGPGSRIIITTRHEYLLTSLRVDERYMAKILNHKESLQLFSWHAFRRTNPLENYAELANGIVGYARGLPLALEVLGSSLVEKKMEVWKDALDRLREIPHEDIQKRLRISFDALGDDKLKDIFLDVACFFVRMDKDYAITILNACDLYAEFGIDALISRCLLKINRQNKLTMHGLLQDMGKEIIRLESPKEFGKRSRLWFHEHIFDVLGKNKGTEKVEGVVLTRLPMVKKIQWSNKAFAGMHNLRLLQINHVHLSGNFKHLLKELRWLCWHYCPLKYLPNNFHPEKLIILDMQFSKIKTLWKDGKHLRSLKILNLSNSKCLTKSPIFCTLLMLEELLLEGCTGLMELHESIGLLDKLIHLNLKDCMNLSHLPRSICNLKSVKRLNLTGCAKLEEFPEYLGDMESLTELFADGTVSIGLLKNLRSFKCSRQLTTKSLRRRFLPSSFFGLRSLTSLYLNDCNLSESDFPADFRSLSLLRMLSLAGNNFHNHLPDCFSHLSRLKGLSLHNCRNLKAISDLPPNLRCLAAPNCASLETISDISKLKTLFISLNDGNDSDGYAPCISNAPPFLKRSENSEGLNRFQGVRITPSDRRNNLQNPRQHPRGIYRIRNSFHIGNYDNNYDNNYDDNFFRPTNTQRRYSFSYKTTGSSLISFKVPVPLKEEIDEYVHAIHVFVVYYRDGDEESCLMPSVIITNKTNCINLTHTPRVFAIPSSCGDYVWHIFTGDEDRIECGDQLEISVNMPSPFKVKQCVVHLLTKDKYCY